jgi:hypothetical protein
MLGEYSIAIDLFFEYWMLCPFPGTNTDNSQKMKGGALKIAKHRG